VLALIWCPALFRRRKAESFLFLVNPPS
jgi:hypothetical protein